MPRRIAKILPYEFGEVIQVSVLDSKTNVPSIVIRVPLGNGNIEHYLNYSVACSKGVVPNQVSSEVFYLTNFFMEKDWINCLSEYDDFCDCKL